MRGGAEKTYDRTDEVPEVMQVRLMARPAFDADDAIVTATSLTVARREPLSTDFSATPR